MPGESNQMEEPGAFELVSRFGRVNLNSGNISGGINTIYSFGLNWWATQYWKAGMFYTISNLDKNDYIGVTNTFNGGCNGCSSIYFPGFK